MTFNSIRRRLLPWHRRLALIIVLPVLAWSLSGLLHPVMSRWQPSAVAMGVPTELLTAPQGLSWADLPAPATTLPTDWRMRELRAVSWQDQPYWRVQLSDGSLQSVQARSGNVESIDEALITHLARHYTGEQEAPVSLSVVTEFSAEYAAVNRYLPVYRVAFDRPDGLLAFIEPRSLQLTGLSDDWKTRFTTFFRAMHNWSWWPHAPSRAWLMAAVLTLVMVMVVSGLARVWPRAGQAVVGRGRGVSLWHRRIGLLAAMAAMAWVSTGALHALVMDARKGDWPTYPLALDFTAAQLSQPAPQDVPTGARLQIVAGPQGPLWYWHQLVRDAAHDGHAHHGPAAPRVLNAAYVHAETGQAVQPEAYWQALAASVAGAMTPISTQAITGFSAEYGFVQKRLPVQQLRYAGDSNLTVYIDPADAAVASVVRDLDRVEGFGFAYLHKAQFLDPLLGKTGRDAVAVVFALLVFGLTLFGLRLFTMRVRLAGKTLD